LTNKALWFRTICRHNNLALNDAQLELVDRYVEQLLAWNQKLNLISRRDEISVWERHILHCASLLFTLVIPPDIRYLDLGTGGGLPGILLKILMPASKGVLLDSTKKKVAAVQEMIGHLRLKQIKAVWGRAEEMAKGEFSKSFDVVFARAVAPLNELVQMAQPFLKDACSDYVHRGGEKRKAVLTTPALVALKGGNLGGEMTKAEKDKMVSSIEVKEILFEGSERLGLIEKKIVVVRYAPGHRQGE
jgi:16S rRNA (guanine527-N7)-methyltransferase